VTPRRRRKSLGAAVRAHAHHEQLTPAEPVDLPADRVLGVVLTVGGVVIGFAPLLHGRSVRAWALAGALACLLLALLRPAWLRPLNRAWMAFGVMASAVVTSVLMLLVFYGVVVPLGCLMRRLGHDPLRLQRAPDAATYWITRDPGEAPGTTMTRQF